MQNEFRLQASSRQIKAKARAATLARVSAITAALIGAPTLAKADPFFVAPTGVATYRLLFVSTTTTAATSADLGHYDAIAAGDAAMNTALPTTNWRAIISTGSVDAINHISCGLACDSSVPIYLVDGRQVATSTASFFTNSLLSSGGSVSYPDETQFGSLVAGQYVWTGSSYDGKAAHWNGAIPGGFGYSQQAIDYFNGSPTPTFGVGATANNGPSYGTPGIYAAQSYDTYYTPGDLTNNYLGSPWVLAPTSLPNSVYALSDVITTDAPEPASAALLLSGLVVTRVFRRRPTA